MIAGTFRVSLDKLIVAHMILLWAGIPAFRVRRFRRGDTLWMNSTPESIETWSDLVEQQGYMRFEDVSAGMHSDESTQKIPASLHANESAENISAGRFLYNDSNVERVMLNASHTVLASSLLQAVHTQNKSVGVLGIIVIAGFGVLLAFCGRTCCCPQTTRQSASVRFSQNVFRVQRCDFSSSDDACHEEDFVKGLTQDDYTWLDPEIAQAQIGSPSKDLVDTLSPRWTNSILREMLIDNGIDANTWSEEQLTMFVGELVQGKCALVRDKDGKMQKRTDIVSVLLVDLLTDTVLQELNHPPYMRDFGELPERLPKSRMRRHETLTDCISRCLQERLNLIDPPIHIDSIRSVIDKAESFPDHLPGVLAITRRYVVLAHVQASTNRDREALGLVGQWLEYDQYCYKWTQVDECHLVKAYLQPKAAKDCTGIRDFGTSILPWKPAAVKAALKRHSIEDPMAAFGKTVEELSAELCTGKLSLGICHKSSRLFCVKEHVSLLLTSKDGKVYMSKKPEHLLPSIAKLSNENVHMAAYRLLAVLFGSDATLAQVEATSPIVTIKVAPERGHISKQVFMSARGKSGHLFT